MLFILLNALCAAPFQGFYIQHLTEDPRQLHGAGNWSLLSPLALELISKRFIRRKMELKWTRSWELQVDSPGCQTEDFIFDSAEIWSCERKPKCAFVRFTWMPQRKEVEAASQGSSRGLGLGRCDGVEGMYLWKQNNIIKSGISRKRHVLMRAGFSSSSMCLRVGSLGPKLRTNRNMRYELEHILDLLCLGLPITP